MTCQEISFSLLNLLGIIHLEWAGDSGGIYTLDFYPKFPYGTSEFVSEFSNDFLWLVAPLLLPFFSLFLWFITDN
jgi:hypothetical protein